MFWFGIFIAFIGFFGFIGFIPFIQSTKNYLVMLFSLEIFGFGIIIMNVITSLVLGDIVGYSNSILLVVITGIESGIGIGILVRYYNSIDEINEPILIIKEKSR